MRISGRKVEDESVERRDGVGYSVAVSVGVKVGASVVIMLCKCSASGYRASG
jgi:hypothetical protein